MAFLLGLLVAILSLHCGYGVLPRHFPSDTYQQVNPPPAAPDPEVLQYLTQLFEHVKESGRQPVHGELNLLPDESKGFANMVRCFPDSALDQLSYTSTNSVLEESNRTLRFDLHGFKATDQIIEVRLVLKQSANAPEYTASVYEMTENGHRLKELDSHVYRGEWLDLEVHKVNDDSPMMTRGEYNNMKSYVLALKISSDVSANLNTTATLNNLKPMLLIYIYDKDMLEHMSKSPNKTSSSTRASSEEQTNLTVKKRQVDYNTVERPSPQPIDDNQPPVQENPPQEVENTFEQMAAQSCRLHVRNMEYEQLGWPEPEITVVSPESLNFTFCYGHCRTPRLRTEEYKYTPHAKVIGILNPDLGEAGLAPCCVPTSFTPISLIFEEDGITTMTGFPDVASCGCL